MNEPIATFINLYQGLGRGACWFPLVRGDAERLSPERFPRFYLYAAPQEGYVSVPLEPTEESSPLRQAAQALVDRWDTPNWKEVQHTGEFIHALRRALLSGPEKLQRLRIALNKFDSSSKGDARYAVFVNEVRAMLDTRPEKNP